MATLRLFAGARDAAGTRHDTFDGDTVDAVLTAACQRYGNGFADVLASCRIWVNGEQASAATRVGPSDEVAVLPPVSGG